MQKGKSFKEAQGQVLRQVLAQFDLQTQINKIAVRCFGDLLEKNKQAFEYLNDNEKRMSEVDLRLTKLQGFAASVQTNVNSKMEIIHGFTHRLQVFNKQFFENMKENEKLIQGMRKDYDIILSSTQKNSHELRAVSDEIKRAQENVRKMEATLEQNLNGFTVKLGENTNNLQNQIIEVRTGIQKLSTAIAESKAELSAKGTNFQEISQDMQLYKHERMLVDRRIKDAVAQITTKANKADVNQIRLYFDSQLTTNVEYNRERFQILSGSIKDQIEDRKREDGRIREEGIRKWVAQDRKNEEARKNLEEVRVDLKSKNQTLHQKIDGMQKEIKFNLEELGKREKEDIQRVQADIQNLSKRGTKSQGRIVDLQTFQKKRHEELIQLTSSFDALNDTVNMIISQNDKRKRDLQKLSMATSQNNVGDEVSSMGGQLESIREELNSQKNVSKGLQTAIEDLGRRQDKTASDLIERGKKWKEALAVERQEIQQKVVEVNRRINDVSIQILDKLQQAEKQAKRYTESVREQMVQKLQIMNVMRKEIQSLKQAFSEQMKETQRLNKALSQKMQKINTMLTKFKSDLLLRLENNVNQLHRRGVQIKQNGKLLQQLRKHISILNESLSIVLAAGVSRQCADDSAFQPIKVSSLLQGWVLEIEEKMGRYRGENLNRRKLLVSCLGYLSTQGDKIKGGIIENGKEVYLRMMDEQEIFSVRKKGLSKRGGSELPKLHY